MKPFLLAVILLGLVSCVNETKKEEDRPFASLPHDSVIPAPVMVQLLADVHITEAALQLQKNKGVEVRDLTREYYAGIFRKYHITQSRYELNLEYYRRDPDQFAKFYEKVETELKRRENELPPSLRPKDHSLE